MRRALRYLTCCCAALFASFSMAAAVTVQVATNAGASATGMIIVFDPLDATPSAVLPEAAPKASIDQVDKRFIPHINVLRTGTSVTFPNSDHIRHQVYSFSQPKVFTLKLYAGAQAPPVTFDRPGLVVLGCNIHDNMVAFVAVVDSPYFAKLPSSGTAVLELPAGRYRLRAWHPKLVQPLASQEIVVKGIALTAPLVATINVDSSTVSPWPER